MFNYLDNLYLDESYLIRYNPSRDFIINWLKGAINELDDYLCVYKNEWLIDILPGLQAGDSQDHLKTK